MENHSEDREKKTPFKAWKALLLVLLYLCFVSFSETVSGDGFSPILVILIVLIVFAVLIFAGTKAGKASRARREAEAFPRPKAAPDPVRQKAKDPVPGQPRPAPVRSYNEHLREAAEERDREQRIRQLENFYKNGLIDKEEYQVLMEKYRR